jgi:hypothetical protein
MAVDAEEIEEAGEVVAKGFRNVDCSVSDTM